MKLTFNLKGRTYILFAFIIFLITFIVYYFTGEEHPRAYNNFVHLADAMLHGRVYFPENISWLELAYYNDRYFVVPPPLPGILILPLVAIFGLTFNQALASMFLGALNVSLAYLVIRKITKNQHIQIWGTILFGFGTIHWWLAATGWVWFYSQITSVTFILLAIYITLCDKSIFLSGLFLGASFWSRLQTILSFPFFLIMNSTKWLNKSEGLTFIKRINISALISFGVGVGIFVVLNFIYNYIRYETIWDVSDYYRPGLLDEPIFQKGKFDISYIPRHLKVIFKGVPTFLSEPPYIKPHGWGLSIFITTPAFIYSIFANLKDKLTIACWSAIIPVALLTFSHGGTGWWAFGYRHAVDYYPFLLILAVKGMGNNIRWHHKLLISLSVLVNLWGVIWFNKIGL